LYANFKKFHRVYSVVYLAKPIYFTAGGVKYDLTSENLCFYRFTIDALRLPKQDMDEFGKCRKCQKCTDFKFTPF